MGNTFPFIFAAFCGHVVERYFVSCSATAVREVGFEGPTRHVAIVSLVQDQSQGRLQMEKTFRTRGSARIAGSFPSPLAFAKANLDGVARTYSAVAAALPHLGQQETSSSAAQGVSERTGSLCANHYKVAQADEVVAAAALPTSRAPVEAAAPDQCPILQRSLDGGLQRLVSYRRWPTSRAFDRPRYVQPLSAEGSSFAGSNLETGAAGFYRSVWAEWVSENYSRGQWNALRIHRAGWAFAFERMVEGFGDCGRIHSARSSRAQRGARANASGAQGRDDSSSFGKSASTTAADESVGEDLQRHSSAPRIGAARTRRVVSAEPIALSCRATELPEPMVYSARAQQRRGKMARPETVYRRGICRIPSWAPASGRSGLEGVLWQFADRRAARTGRRRNASGESRSTILRDNVYRASTHRNLELDFAAPQGCWL